MSDRPDLMFHHYRGIPIQQNEHVVHPFRAMFRDLRPARVIEIGTAAGGLTLLLRGLLDEAGPATGNSSNTPAGARRPIPASTTRSRCWRA